MANCRAFQLSILFLLSFPGSAWPALGAGRTHYALGAGLPTPPISPDRRSPSSAAPRLPAALPSSEIGGVGRPAPSAVSRGNWQIVELPIVNSVVARITLR